MPRITFITPDGESVEVEAAAGTLMEAAVRHGVDGIDAECGGVCSCATCHIRVAPGDQDRLPGREAAEETLLELEDEANEQSRLSCQIPVTDELDGLVVHVVGR